MGIAQIRSATGDTVCPLPNRIADAAGVGWQALVAMELTHGDKPGAREHCAKHPANPQRYAGRRGRRGERCTEGAAGRYLGVVCKDQELSLACERAAFPRLPRAV